MSCAIVLSCKYFHYNTEMLFMKYNFTIFFKCYRFGIDFPVKALFNFQNMCYTINVF